MSTTIPPRSRLAPATLLALALALTGCSDVSSLEDINLVSFNPFAEKEKRVPGDRRPAIETTDGLRVAENTATTPVSLPAPRDLGDWSQPGGNAANAPGNVALGSGSATWSVSVASVDRRGRLTAKPIVYRGLVVVMDQHARVSAYSLEGGGRGWSVSLKPEKEKSVVFNGGIAAEGGIVVAATGYGTMVGIGASDGGVLWTTELGAPARSAPTIADGIAYVVSADNVVHAVNIADGSVLWTQIGIGQAAGVIGNASPAVSGGIVVVPYSSGEILAFDAKSGEPRWIDALTGANRFTAVSGISDVAASPVIYEGDVYAVSVSGRMIGVSARNGDRIWAQNVSSAHTPAVAGNTIFVATIGAQVVALDRKTGQVRWMTDLSEKANPKDKLPVNLAGPLLAGGRLWVATSDGRMITLNPETGAVLSTQTIGSPVYISPIAAGGRILVLDNTGKLTAFN